MALVDDDFQLHKASLLSIQGGYQPRVAFFQAHSPGCSSPNR